MYEFQNKYCFDPLTNENVRFFNEDFVGFIEQQGIRYEYVVLDEVWWKGYYRAVKWRVFIKDINDYHLILINFGDMFEKKSDWYFDNGFHTLKRLA